MRNITEKKTPAFHGGAFFSAIGDDFLTLEKSASIINADVLDAWFPPSPLVTQAIQDYLPWLIRTSPPTHCDGMVKTIAETRMVAPENILVGAGSSDLMFRSFNYWLNGKSRVLIIDPTYGEYGHILDNVIGCKTDRLLLKEENSFAFDPKDMEQLLSQQYDLIVIVNPNNPTGSHTKRSDLEDLLLKVPFQTRVWIDEAYVEYAGPDESLETFAITRENVIVCKSMSKVYALSGIRAGYLCAQPQTLNPLRALTPPWIVSLPGQIAATMALRDPQYYESCYAATHLLRSELVKTIATRTSIEIFEGVANYILCYLPQDGIDLESFIDQCQAQGLFIRNVWTTAPRLGSNTFRIAVKDHATNKHMVEIIESVVNR